MTLSRLAASRLLIRQAPRPLSAALTGTQFATATTTTTITTAGTRGFSSVVSSTFPSSSLAAPSPSLPVASRETRNLASSAATVAQEQEDVPPSSPDNKAAPFVSKPDRKFEFFQNVELTDSGVAIIRFDCPKPVNTISFALGEEAQKLWATEIEHNDDVKAVIWASAKPNMFVAGADIFDIQQTENKQDLLKVIEDSVNFFQHMRTKNIPFVAAIDGPALGGGLEWALWCDYRICTDNPKTKLGLPEVKLGLLPGFGGTQNLPAVVGLQNGMDMMLTGKEIRADKAKKMGLVDLVVSPPSLESAAIQVAENLANGSLKAKRKKKTIVNRLIEDNVLGQKMVWNTINKMVEKNTAGNYPAPLAIIKCVQYGLENPKGNAKFQHEREQFVKLAETPESEALIGIFDGMTKMKKHSYGDNVALPVQTVAVMGAGLMGAGIAQVTAEKGLQVLLKDRDDESVGRGLSYMQGNWQKKLSRRRMTQYKFNTSGANVTALTDDIPSWKRHFGRADMIIEAVFEDLDLKKKIVAEMEQVTPDHCIFASNTSAIPIADIAEGAARPENIVGMHYFSPVPSMPLLEIIPHEGTSDATTATAFEVGAKQGKTCIVTKDVPGFYVNRCLGPFLSEVTALVKDGAKLEDMDRALKNFGMPVGPITLADEVGVDVVTHVAKFLGDADLGVRMHGGDFTLLESMLEKGWLGKKTGKGFYTYDKKKKTINAGAKAMAEQFATRDLGLEESEIQNRLISRFVNEAAKCVEDEIIEDFVAGDIGLVFGTGFAPFRGGPFRYLDQVGVANYADMMNGFADKYGPQFEPCQLIKDYAASGKKFHR